MEGAGQPSPTAAATARDRPHEHVEGPAGAQPGRWLAYRSRAATSASSGWPTRRAGRARGSTTSPSVSITSRVIGRASR